jgi:hypothetical protein
MNRASVRFAATALVGLRPEPVPVSAIRRPSTDAKFPRDPDYEAWLDSRASEHEEIS